MKNGTDYIKIVRWSDEDGCFVGTCPGLMLGGVHGDDEAEVYKRLCEAVREAIELHEEDGTLPLPTRKELSGKFLFRPGKDIHEALHLQALLRGKSLNEVTSEAVRRGIRVMG